MSGRFYYPVAKAILQVVFDGNDDRPRIIPVLPKAATVHRNGYQQADSWELTFDADDLPIDPRQVRAGAAEIFLYQTLGIAQNQRVVSRQFATSDDATAIKARTSLDALNTEFSLQGARDKFTFGNKPMVAGRFDQHDLEMSNDGRWVTISGQDYTALLAMKQWPPTAKHTARKIPVGKRLDAQLKAILAEADPDRVLSLSVEGVESSELPVVGAKEANTSKFGIPVEEQTSYWDIMYKLASRYGFILFVRGLDVVLTKPKILDQTTETPKQLAWGNNLESLRLTRHMGKEKTPRIIVIGGDRRQRQRVIAEYPNTGLKGKTPTLKGKAASKTTRIEKQSTAGTGRPKKAAPLTKEDEFKIYMAWGVSDLPTLQRMAETRYHLLARGERTMVAVTRDLDDMRESSLMDLTAGDAVDVNWDDFDRDALERTTDPNGRYKLLIDRGFNSEVAKAIADNYSLLIGKREPLRVREATYEFSVDDGIRIELELADFAIIDGPPDGIRKESASKKRRDRVRRADGTRVGNSRVDSVAK